jgi:hypothetical protein
MNSVFHILFHFHIVLLTQQDVLYQDYSLYDRIPQDLTTILTSYFDQLIPIPNLQLSICLEKKKQLDATEWFIALIICSTCFGHFYVHHQELETICVLLSPMVCSALVAGCRGSGARQQAMRPR